MVSAGVDAGSQQWVGRAIRLAPRLEQEVVKVVPHLIRQHIAVDFLVADAPALHTLAPADHLNFKAVVLHVNTGSKIQNIVRHFCGVDFAAVEQLGVLQLDSTLFPRFAQLGVHPNFHLFGVAVVKGDLGFYELLHDLFPAHKG